MKEKFCICLTFDEQEYCVLRALLDLALQLPPISKEDKIRIKRIIKQLKETKNGRTS